MDQSNQQLIMEAIRGDKIAVNDLVEKYYQRIFYYTFQRFGQDAEDVTQKAFVRIITSLKNLRDPNKFEPWMMRIVKNVCNDEMKIKYRDQKLYARLDDDDEVEMMSINLENLEFLPEEYVLNAELREKVISVIKTLPENYSDTLLQFYFHDMSYEDIAKARNVNVTKVKNDLNRGRMRLKQKLEKMAGKEFMFSIVPIGMVPMLTRLFNADASAVLAPDACARVLVNIQKSIAQIDLSSQVTSGIVMKSVIGGALVLAVFGGVLMLLPKNNGQNAPSLHTLLTSAAPSQTPEAGSASEPDSEPFIIITIEDMIGEEEALELLTFETGPVDATAWLDFVARIGADIEGTAVEYDKEYIMYLLRKQDKQLFLAERKNLDSREIDVFYHFGSIEEPPMMIEIMLLFNVS